MLYDSQSNRRRTPRLRMHVEYEWDVECGMTREGVHLANGFHEYTPSCLPPHCLTPNERRFEAYPLTSVHS